MSALLIFSLTYFCAESTARCTSSGCIELTSNSSVIRRRPAIDSEVGTSAGFAAAAPEGALLVSSLSLASTPARRSAVSIAAGGLSLISSKLKFRTSCGRPSSRTSKSAAVSPRTIAPLLSRTMASTVITSRRVRNTPPGDCTGATGAGVPAGGCCSAEGPAGVKAATTKAAMRSLFISKFASRFPFADLKVGPARQDSSRGPQPSALSASASEPESQIERHRAHRPDGEDLAERRRVHDRVDAGVVDHVQQVGRVQLQGDGAVAAHAHVARELRVQLLAAGTDDQVARRVAEEA